MLFHVPHLRLKLPNLKLDLPTLRKSDPASHRTAPRFKWSDLHPSRLSKRRLTVLTVRSWRFIKHELGVLAGFLKNSYVDGLQAILSGDYTGRQAAMIILGMIPMLLCIALMILPAVLFPTPEHHAFYHFGRYLSEQVSTGIPLIIGLISTTLGLKIPA